VLQERLGDKTANSGCNIEKNFTEGAGTDASKTFLAHANFHRVGEPSSGKNHRRKTRLKEITEKKVGAGTKKMSRNDGKTKKSRLLSFVRRAQEEILLKVKRKGRGGI